MLRYISILYLLVMLALLMGVAVSVSYGSQSYVRGPEYKYDHHIPFFVNERDLSPNPYLGQSGKVELESSSLIPLELEDAQETAQDN